MLWLFLADSLADVHFRDKLSFFIQLNCACAQEKVREGHFIVIYYHDHKHTGL